MRKRGKVEKTREEEDDTGMVGKEIKIEYKERRDEKKGRRRKGDRDVKERQKFSTEQKRKGRKGKEFIEDKAAKKDECKERTEERLQGEISRRKII